MRNSIVAVVDDNTNVGQNGDFRRDEMCRFGSGVVLPVHIEFFSTEDAEKKIFIKEFDGSMIRMEDPVHRLRKFANDNSATPSFKTKGKYCYDEDRVLTESDFMITEDLGEYYHTHTDCNLRLDEPQKPQ